MFGSEPHQSANFMAGGRREPLLPLAHPLLEQSATLGEVGISTVARFRALSRAVFSYLQAGGFLDDSKVTHAVKAKSNSPDLVNALRVLSPARVLEAAYGGRVPAGLLTVLKHASETKGLMTQDASLLKRWFTPASSQDRHRGRLLLEALETLKQNDEPACRDALNIMIENIRDLPEQSLSFLRFREVGTVRDVVLGYEGAETFERTITHVASVCSGFDGLKDQISVDLKAGKPLGAVLRQLLEDHADDLPKPKFPIHAEVEVLRPKQAAQLSIDWQNCIRGFWLDSMLAGDIAFVRSKEYELVALLRRVHGPHSTDMWMLEEVAAPKNEAPDDAQKTVFVLELQRGDVVVVPEQEAIGDFLYSVIARRPMF